MAGDLHLLKLCVGADSVADLAAWQETRAAQAADGRPRHVTRMWPRREAELLDGGSIYWVIRGVIQARQRVVSLEERIGEDGIRRCALVLDPALVPTAPVPRSPFQGWRYLAGSDAPPDRGRRDGATDLPASLEAALAELGVV